MSGYFFQKNRQRIAQWNPTRRAAPWGRGPIPQIVLHTFEWPPDRSMMSAATFLLTRTTHGSYHSLAGGASERDVLRLAPVTAETWHCVPSNNWASGVSATTYASHWRRLSATKRRNFVHSMAYASYLLSQELIAIGKSPVPAKRITRSEAMRGVWGFTYHRTMDPSRRTDPANPADDFPWDEFLTEYTRLMGGTTTTRDWFDMATKEELKEAIREAVPGAVWGHRTDHANLDAWGLLRHAYNQAGTTSTGDIQRIANATFMRIMGDVHHKGRGSDFRGTVVEIDKAAQAILAGVESLAGAVAALDAGEGFDQQAFLDGFEERFKKALAESVTVGGEVWVEPRTTDNESEEG